MDKEQRAERNKRFAHLGVEIPRDLHNRLKEIAKRNEITVSEIVRNALNKHLVDF